MEVRRSNKSIEQCKYLKKIIDSGEFDYIKRG